MHLFFSENPDFHHYMNQSAQLSYPISAVHHLFLYVKLHNYIYIPQDTFRPYIPQAAINLLLNRLYILKYFGTCN